MTDPTFDTNAPDPFVDAILRSLVHPFYVIDVETYELVMANPAARALGEPGARTCHLLTHRNPKPCDSAEHGCPLKEVLGTGKNARMVHTHYDREGNPRLFEVHGFPVRRDGRIVQMIEYSIDITDSVRAEEEHKRMMEAADENQRLRERLIAEQERTIRELSTPILELWDGLLVLPVVGSIDAKRGQEMTQTLLDVVAEKRCRTVIVDLTGIETMDGSTADQFIKLVRALRLLGANSVISGISLEVAATISELRLDLGDAVTVRTLRDGLLWFMENQAGAGELVDQRRVGSRKPAR